MFENSPKREKGEAGSGDPIGGRGKGLSSSSRVEGELKRLTTLDLSAAVSRELEDPQKLLELGSCIDVTRLLETDTTEDIKRFFDEVGEAAVEGNLSPAAVCIYPRFISEAKRAFNFLGGVKVATVAGGFPYGQGLRASRVEEVRRAIGEGADEIDYLFPYTLFLEGREGEVMDELEEAREACGASLFKVIMEGCYFGRVELLYRASLLSLRAGADFLKTSTGFTTEGATLRSVTALSVAARDFSVARGIKPSGGISSIEQGMYYRKVVELLLNRSVDKTLFRIGSSRLFHRVVRAVSKV